MNAVAPLSTECGIFSGKALQHTVVSGALHEAIVIYEIQFFRAKSFVLPERAIHGIAVDATHGLRAFHQKFSQPTSDDALSYSALSL